VRVGDPLSTGTLNPRTLVGLKGAGAGRLYLAKKMREVYSRNAQLDPRHFDVIARNMIRYSEVKDPGDSGFMPGDKVNINQIEDHLEHNAKKTEIGKAENLTLASRILDLTPGTVLTKNHLDDLAGHGITHVMTSDSGLVVQPLVPGLQSLKFLDKNWISKLSFNRLHMTIQEAAALGQHSPIHGTEPITAFAMGTEFGEGEKGRY
jgi:DNA-directed RNA polymerase subunit beta'